MTLPAGSWRISRIANSARRSIESLDLDTQGRILEEIEGLQASPFSGDVKRIKGQKDLFRLRSGKFRIYFRIVASARLIEILLFDRKGAIKDNKIRRL